MARTRKDRPRLAKNLRVIRERLELTQQQAAERIGTLQSTFSNWETGRVKPSAESIAAIARGLAISADELLAGLAAAAVDNAGRASPQEPRPASGRRAGSR